MRARAHLERERDVLEQLQRRQPEGLCPHIVLIYRAWDLVCLGQTVGAKLARLTARHAERLPVPAAGAVRQDAAAVGATHALPVLPTRRGCHRAQRRRLHYTASDGHQPARSAQPDPACPPAVRESSVDFAGPHVQGVGSCAQAWVCALGHSGACARAPRLYWRVQQLTRASQPDNILVQNGVFKLADFGLAKRCDAPSLVRNTLPARSHQLTPCDGA